MRDLITIEAMVTGFVDAFRSEAAPSYSGRCTVNRVMLEKGAVYVAADGAMNEVRCERAIP